MMLKRGGWLLLALIFGRAAEGAPLAPIPPTPVAGIDADRSTGG